MRSVSVCLAAVLGWSVAFSAFGREIRGSGSTSAFPILSVWAAAYGQTGGDTIEYEPTGSSAGIREMRAGTVDFGVTDAPLPSEQLRAQGWGQFPLVMGGLAPVFHLSGIGQGQMRFTGQLLADIYLGKVRKWNDPEIASINPGVALPNRQIIVIYRSDGAGDTFSWSNYLTKTSAAWKARVGQGSLLAWPVGHGVVGNYGVATTVAGTNYAIGYVNFAYVAKYRLTFGMVRNRAGNFIVPSPASFAAASAGVQWSDERDFYNLLTDAPGSQAYPIATTSFAIINASAAAAAQTSGAIAFFRWALLNGSARATALSYVPLPTPLVEQVEGYWQARLHDPRS